MMLAFSALQLVQASVDAALAYKRLQRAQEDMREHDMIDGGAPHYREDVLRLPPPADPGV